MILLVRGVGSVRVAALARRVIVVRFGVDRAYGVSAVQTGGRCPGVGIGSGVETSVATVRALISDTTGTAIPPHRADALIGDIERMCLRIDRAGMGSPDRPRRGHRLPRAHCDGGERMIGQHRCVADLGSVRVAVATDHLGLLDYLRDFYPLDKPHDAESPADWTIEARLAAPVPGMTLTPWQVGYRADRDTRHAMIRSTDARNLAITTRKAIREVLLDYCEAHRYTMLHASALANDQHVIIVVGDKGSGKTMLAVNGALTAGYRYLSNDHLILYRTADDLVLTSLPTPIPIKIGTYLDYADQLGEPWENEGVDIEAYRRMPVEQRYGHDRRLLYGARLARAGRRD